MKLLVEIPDDGDWVVETADEGHRFAGELVLSYRWDYAPSDIRVLQDILSTEAVQRAARRLREIEAAAVAGLRETEIIWVAREVLLAAIQQVKS